MDIDIRLLPAKHEMLNTFSAHAWNLVHYMLIIGWVTLNHVVFMCI